ncbi:hypothetical protein EON66_07985 [archaeon]|nr:MAG: hypothetical protein EON66_07985 [archaeon]
MAKSVSMDAPAAAVSLMGDAVQEATTVIAHATKDTLTATDRVLEALALAAEETEKWTEYAQDVATATAAGEDAAAVVEMPARNPLLLNLTPAAYVLRTLRAVRPSDLDQVLLVLPFADALHLLRYLHHCLTRGQGVELACRAALLLLRVHQAQIVSNQALRPLIAALCTAMHEAARAHVDRIGFNIAGLHYIESLLAHVAMPKLVEPPKKKKSEGFRAGKRRRVRIM